MSKTVAIPVEEVLLGCAPSAGLYHKTVGSNEVFDLVRRAVDHHNIREIDTAPWYGAGKSELDLGAAILRLEPESQAKVQIITKVGRVTRLRSELDPRNPTHAAAMERDTCYKLNELTDNQVCLHLATHDGVLESYRQSKDRLGPAAHITTLRMHDADTDALLDQCIQFGGINALLDLRREGAIQRVSIGMNVPKRILQLIQAFPDGTFDNVMMAGCWNLIDQSGVEVLEVCARRGIAVHNAGVFGAGLLWGGDKYRYDSAGSEVVQRRDRWAALAAAHGISLPSLAIAFARIPKAVSRVAFGCASAKELDGCMEAAGRLPDDATLDAILEAAAREKLVDMNVIRRARGVRSAKL